jgi:hypothetical protein
MSNLPFSPTNHVLITLMPVKKKRGGGGEEGCFEYEDKQ